MPRRIYLFTFHPYTVLLLKMSRCKYCSLACYRIAFKTGNFCCAAFSLARATPPPRGGWHISFDIKLRYT